MPRQPSLPDSLSDLPSPSEFLSPERRLDAITEVLADIMLDAMKPPLKPQTHEDNC
jgi:hypothetical protein